MSKLTEVKFGQGAVVIYLCSKCFNHKGISGGNRYLNGEWLYGNACSVCGNESVKIRVVNVPIGAMHVWDHEEL